MSEKPAAAELAASALAPALSFEQPLNERMRTFLRLDFLYTQAVHHNEMSSQWGSRAAVASLLDMIAISARSDVRSDVLKELERNLSALNEFQTRPGVDASRLRAIMTNLIRLRAELLATGANCLQGLKESEFLSAIKHRSAIPGGTCEFDLPDFYFWLNQSDAVRMATFVRWQTLLRPLCDAIAELLWLTRQNGRPRRKSRTAGPTTSPSIATTRSSCCAFCFRPAQICTPEISGSHYRCSVRFLEWTDIDSRPKQTDVDVPFTLTCCP